MQRPWYLRAVMKHLSTLNIASPPRSILAWASPLLFASAVLCTRLVFALPPPPPDGGDHPTPGYDCATDMTATLHATPSVVDLRLPGTSRTTTLTWSVNKPAHCTGISDIQINGQSVPLTGSMTDNLPFQGVNSFALNVLFSGGGSMQLAGASVRVEPGPLALSPGRRVVEEDLRQFDDQWMFGNQPQDKLRFYSDQMAAHNLAVSWEINERMLAMARMFELTRNTQYLDHMQAIIEVVLRYRDDALPNGEVHLDAFHPDRHTPMPAWGTGSNETAFLWRTMPDIAGVYAHPIAVFARIVAEGGYVLQGIYGSKARIYANAALETFQAFEPDWRLSGSGSQSFMTLVEPRISSSLLSTASCAAARDEATRREPSNERLWNSNHGRCVLLAEHAGIDVPHNHTHAMAMLGIELHRALSTDFYRWAPIRAVTQAELDTIVRTIESSQRYFMNAMNLVTGRDSTEGEPPVQDPQDLRFEWRYQEGRESHREDTSHGSFSMRYLGVLRENQIRLQAALPGTDIKLSDDDKRKFASTFLNNVHYKLPGLDSHLAENVAGGIASPRDRRDGACEGWLYLTQVDARIYDLCAEIALRMNGYRQQPNLSIATHSALLINNRDAYGAIADGVYQIAATHSGKCVDVDTWNRSPESTANIQQWTCNGGTNQQWRFRHLGGNYYEIKAEHSQLCMDVEMGSMQPHANVWQYWCNGGAAQRWYVSVAAGTAVLTAQVSDLCLDVDGASTADGANVKQFTCWGHPAQRFVLTRLR